MCTTSRPIIAQPPPGVVQTPTSQVFQIIPFEGVATQVVRQPLPPYEPGSEHRPDRLSLGTLSDHGFRVVKPIPVRIEPREDGVVASWLEIDEFGIGTSTSSSAEDLGHTLAELYRSLASEPNNLGPDLQRVWATLQEFIVPYR